MVFLEHQLNPVNVRISIWSHQGYRVRIELNLSLIRLLFVTSSQSVRLGASSPAIETPSEVAGENALLDFTLHFQFSFPLPSSFIVRTQDDLVSISMREGGECPQYSPLPLPNQVPFILLE